MKVELQIKIENGISIADTTDDWSGYPRMIFWLFTPLMPGGNKRSRTFKQICSFSRQVSLSLYDLLSPPGMTGLKENAYNNAFA